MRSLLADGDEGKRGKKKTTTTEEEEKKRWKDNQKGKTGTAAKKTFPGLKEGREGKKHLPGPSLRRKDPYLRGEKKKKKKKDAEGLPEGAEGELHGP